MYSSRDVMIIAFLKPYMKTGPFWCPIGHTQDRIWPIYIKKTKEWRPLKSPGDLTISETKSLHFNLLPFYIYVWH